MLNRMFSLMLLVLSAGAMMSANANTLPDFSGLAERLSPAVVKIQTESKSGIPEIAGLPPGQEIPEMFRHMFPFPQQIPGQPRMQQGIGSGFIIDTAGYVITNHHVIDGAQRIVVKLIDRREFEAQLVGTDQRSDLALLKIEASDLPVVQFADSADRLKVGEWVMAIGSPFDLDYSVSVGVVSAIGRSLPNERNENYVPFIQTDVAINPGNSGGPLFDLDGKVVGINSQIFTRSGGSMGLSFAIPASVAQSVIGQLRQTGYVTRGWLGVAIQEVNKDLADSFGLAKPMGALVADIVPNSPAQKAGIHIGDIILAFNGEQILYSEELPHKVGGVAPGTPGELTVLREGQRQTLQVTVGALPGDQAAGKPTPAKQAARGNRLGLVVQDLDGNTRQELGIAGGVKVVDVQPGSPADETGLLPGDIITQLGFTPVKSAADFEQKVSAMARGGLQPIRFYREGRPIFRTIIAE